MIVTIENRSPAGAGGWTCIIPPEMTDDELAEAMVSLFAAVAERPDANLLQLQMKMMRAVQRSGEGGSSAPPDELAG